MGGMGSHFALHLPFYDAKSVAKVECQHALGRLKARFQTAATAYRKTPFIFHFQETAMNRIYKVIWNSETEQ